MPRLLLATLKSVALSLTICNLTPTAHQPGKAPRGFQADFCIRPSDMLTEFRYCCHNQGQIIQENGFGFLENDSIPGAGVLS
ncbi:hypothetical protein CUMW_214880 [Citrus unshiu]|uniref:SREBP regulating gene protein n=1 Tax=Citrus unshiu TaxID=55188 RepID=A0A2H5QBP0_CITUN|nr:hypothetical protein CUMW_214880 [Citrus unshiu]